MEVPDLVKQVIHSNKNGNIIRYLPHLNLDIILIFRSSLDTCQNLFFFISINQTQLRPPMLYLERLQEPLYPSV